MKYKKQHGCILSNTPREEVINFLKQDLVTYQQFLNLTDSLQEELVGFCMGNRGLKITYDPFFKLIFDPVKHRLRLEKFLSAIIGEPVKIKNILPNESRRLAGEASFIIMDILVELESGKLVNVEIQKIGYEFPGQRSACYSADLIMREYASVKDRMKENFNYRHMEKVITIVIIENSTKEFHQTKESYIHHFKQMSDTHLELNLLQEYIFIALDIFHEITHNIITELDAWMFFLGSDKPADIMRVIEAYPYFRELYAELVTLQSKPRELVNMFSEELAIMDRNTAQYMIDEERKRVQELERLIREKDRKLEEKDQKLKENNQEIQKLKDKVAQWETTQTV